MSSKEAVLEPDPNLIKQATRLAEKIINGHSKHPERKLSGRGIVTSGGGYKHFPSIWVQANLLRHLNCQLPIEVWHLGRQEIDGRMKRLLARLDVKCVDALEQGAPERLFGMALNAFAIARCSFEEVLSLDAGTISVCNPSSLFDTDELRKNGAILWPGVKLRGPSDPIWKIFGAAFTEGTEIDGGQCVLNTRANRRALNVVEQLNLHPEDFHALTPSMGDLFHFALKATGRGYSTPEFPPQVLTAPNWQGKSVDAVLCQHDFNGNRLFQRRFNPKWDLLGENPWLSGSFHEALCHGLLEELKRRWGGRVFPYKAPLKHARLSRVRQSLLEQTWLIETTNTSRIWRKVSVKSLLAKAPAGTKIPAFAKLPPEIGKIALNGEDTVLYAKPRGWLSELGCVKELSFAPNGTLKNGGDDQIGYFWDLKQTHDGVELVLSTDAAETIKLRQTTQFRWDGDDCALRRVDDVYPCLAHNMAAPLTARSKNEIRDSFPKVVHVACSVDNITDQVAGAQACIGLARLGVRVIYHTKCADWFKHANEPGFTATAHKRDGCIDLNHNRDHLFRYGLSRASWYAAALHPLLKPAMPNFRRREIVSRFPFEKYILFAPISRIRNRNWPENHWTRLSNILRGCGHELVAIGSDEQGASLMRMFGQTQTYWALGNEPEWIIDALLGSRLYVGVDGNITQFATILGVKSVVIHAQMPPSFTFPYGSPHSIVPQTKCTFCRGQTDRGYLRSSCDTACSALATVGPEVVAQKILDVLSEGGTLMREMPFSRAVC